MKRVAVTGIGLVTPLAVGTEANWGRLLAGESGLRPMTGFDTDDLPCRVAGQVPGPEASDGLDIDALFRRDRRRLDRSSSTASRRPTKRSAIPAGHQVKKRPRRAIGPGS